jgi:hypothetical protein
MDNIPVVLTMCEMITGSQIGARRQCYAIYGKLKDTNSDDPLENPWEAHVRGALAEMAVAKHFKLYWSGSVGEVGGDDVGPFQVKHSKHDLDLIIQKRCRPDRKYILVACTAPNLILRGWFWGADAKVDHYWGDKCRNSRPAFFVPQSELHSVTELDDEARKWA